MRIEAGHFLAYGALVFAAVMVGSGLLRRPALALHLRAVAFAACLGIAVVPGHGEIVLVPVLALLAKGGSALIYGIAGTFALLAWLAAFTVLSLSRRRRR